MKCIDLFLAKRATYHEDDDFNFLSRFCFAGRAGKYGTHEMPSAAAIDAC